LRFTDFDFATLKPIEITPELAEAGLLHRAALAIDERSYGLDDPAVVHTELGAVIHARTIVSKTALLPFGASGHLDEKPTVPTDDLRGHP